MEHKEKFFLMRKLCLDKYRKNHEALFMAHVQVLGSQQKWSYGW